jgi:hypothetical protein
MMMSVVYLGNSHLVRFQFYSQLTAEIMSARYY